MSYNPPQPPPTGTPAVGRAEVERMVSGPATGLMITAIVGIVFSVLGLLMNLLGMGMAGLGGALGEFGAADTFLPMMSGAFAIMSSIIGIGIGVLILFAASKMKKLESHGLSIAGAIVAMIPCISPCCILGLPIGIWALVVLLKPEVKAAFV